MDCPVACAVRIYPTDTGAAAVAQTPTTVVSLEVSRTDLTAKKCQTASDSATIVKTVEKGALHRGLDLWPGNAGSKVTKF